MKKNKIYVNRELSWLKFNERVLEEAMDENVPLCERLSFLSIFQSNLEEFYMVRVGTLQDQMLLDEKIKDNKTGMTSAEQIDAIVKETRRLGKLRDKVYGDIMNEVGKFGLREVRFKDLNSEEAEHIERYFDIEIMPVLSPMIVGKKQSFPFMATGMVYAVVVMESVRGKEKIGIIPCNSVMTQKIVMLPEGNGRYMSVEEIILHFADRVFGSYNIKAKSLVKITRNADINVETINDEDLNYRDAMSEAVKRRKKLEPVRMEMTRELDMKVVRALCNNLGMDHSRVFASEIPLNMSFVSKIRDMLREHTELFYKRYVPRWNTTIDKNRSMLEQILEKDLFLSYPYDSVKPFLNMLHEAANDENVVAVRMTLYRLAKNSKVVEALVDAAENGKEVTVLVELKARFDEENNIEWSRTLEDAGCHVIYGIDGVKVHSKLCQIVRKNGDNIEYITQIGTGNYNENTAKLYTDLVLMTADARIGADVANVFRSIGVGEVAKPQENILVAPDGLQNRLIDMIDEQIALAEKGEKAYIGLKVNSVTDIKLMKKLIEASKAGVKIDMIVRGICCLVAGVQEETENISVISIVGRYLEHSRIYIFGINEPKVYISSADWMTRNTRKRIEVAAPIYDECIKQRIIDMFNVMLNDNVKARKMMPDSTYVRVRDMKENTAKDAGSISISAQEMFMERTDI